MKIIYRVLFLIFLNVSVAHASVTDSNGVVWDHSQTVSVTGSPNSWKYYDVASTGVSQNIAISQTGASTIQVDRAALLSFYNEPAYGGKAVMTVSDGSNTSWRFFGLSGDVNYAVALNNVGQGSYTIYYNGSVVPNSVASGYGRLFWSRENTIMSAIPGFNSNPTLIVQFASSINTFQSNVIVVLVLMVGVLLVFASYYYVLRIEK